MEEREHTPEQPQPTVDGAADTTPQAAAFAQWERATPPVVWWRRRPVQIGAAAGAALVIAIAVWLTMGGSSATAPAAAASPTPTGALVEGTLDLSFGSSFAPNATDPEPDRTAGPRVGDPCTASGGYDDITPGAAVTIGDGSGQTLAVTALSAGSVAVGSQNQALCEFSFTVRVPAGRGTYTVSISHRGTQVFTEAQIEQPITLTLGS